MQEKSEAPKKSTRCAIYTRVSTDMQTEGEFNSCDAQEERIRAFIASQEGFEVFKVYIDPGYSAGTVNRPAMQEMLRAIRDGLVDMIITYKIDRLTRSPRDFYQLIEFFEKYNAGYISVTERFDTSTPSGRLLRNIMLTFAQFERELASERVKDKVLQRAQKGLFMGGPVPFGYKAVDKKLVLDPPRDEAVRLMFNTYVETRSICQVQQRLKGKGVLSRKGKELTDSFIWHLLRNRVLTGKIVHKEKVYSGQHPAIVSEELFDHVQKLVAEVPRRPAETIPALPFAGLIHCQHCGYAMTPAFADKMNKSGLRRYHYYRCSNITRAGWATCPIKEINADRFENILYSNLLRISKDEDHLKNLVFTRQNQTRNEGSSGFEPHPSDPHLNPENLKTDIKEFLTMCARRTGMERILAIRRRIEGISYSKKTISVEFIYSRPPDGKSVINESNSSAALRAAPPALPAAPKRKESNLKEKLDSDLWLDGFKDGDFLKNFKIVVPFDFPNIAHAYWENFRMTGDFYLPPAKRPGF